MWLFLGGLAVGAIAGYAIAVATEPKRAEREQAERANRFLGP